MSKYCQQGSKSKDLGGVTAPLYGCGEHAVIREAEKPTTGIVGDKGIGKNGLPIKGGK